MNKKLIVTILIVLIVVSLVQAVQLNNIKNALEDGEVIINGDKPKTDNSPLQTGIQDLPPIVGSC